MLKQQATSELLSQGYTVHVEYKVKIDEKLFIVDVAGFKGKESVAIECGRTKYSKIEKLRTFFSKVRRLYYTATLSPKGETIRRRLKQTFTQAIYTVHGHGRIQIPKVIRDDLGLKDGDKVLIIRDFNGKYYFEKRKESERGLPYTPTTRRP